MFSSCCRCVNKKAVLKDEQLSENESDDSKSEKVPEDSNLIQKIPLRDPNVAAHTNGVKVECDTTAGATSTSVNVIDTVIKEEAEEDITSPSDPASLIDKGDTVVDEDDNDGETSKNCNYVKESENNGGGGDSSIRSANTLNLVSNASSNISDEEKQKILEQQQHASTDNEDDGTCLFMYKILTKMTSGQDLTRDSYPVIRSSRLQTSLRVFPKAPNGLLM